MLVVQPWWAGVTASTPTPPPSGSTAAEAYNAPYLSSDLFTPASSYGDVWNTPIPDDAVVEADSQAQVDFLVGKMDTPANVPGHWWFSNFVVYVVNAHTPLRSVGLRFAFDSNPPSFASWTEYMHVHDILMERKVPIPDDGLPWTDGGDDHGCTIYSPETNQLWDLYQVRKASAGTVDLQGRMVEWIVDVGQRMRMVNSNPGYFRQDPTGDLNAEYRRVARRASKLPSLAGAITPQEWNDPPADGFGHKLQASLPWGRCVYDPAIGTCSQAGAYVWPAAATDNWSAWGYPAIREGSVMRLRPDENTDQWNAEIDNPATTSDRRLFLRRVRALAKTWQHYGAIGGDQTGNGFGLNFRAGHLTPDGGYAPNGQPGGYHWPNEYIQAFWSMVTRMQILVGPNPAPEWHP